MIKMTCFYCKVKYFSPKQDMRIVIFNREIQWVGVDKMHYFGQDTDATVWGSKKKSDKKLPEKYIR